MPLRIMNSPVDGEKLENQFQNQGQFYAFQLSLDYTKSPRDHYNLATELASLRDNGVLIIGSGNMVHNLGLVAWDQLCVTGGSL